MLYYSTFMRTRIVKFIKTGSEIVVARGWGLGGVGNGVTVYWV